jgi:hypothetical protein
VDIVELAPEMDEDKKTGKLVVELAANLFGSAYNWYTHYMKQEVDKQTARNSKK